MIDPRPEDELTAHDHGNCELCDQIEAELTRLRAALQTAEQANVDVFGHTWQSQCEAAHKLNQTLVARLEAAEAQWTEFNAWVRDEVPAAQLSSVTGPTAGKMAIRALKAHIDQLEREAATCTQMDFGESHAAAVLIVAAEDKVRIAEQERDKAIDTAINDVWDEVLQAVWQAWPGEKRPYGDCPTELIIDVINERDEAREQLTALLAALRAAEQELDAARLGHQTIYDEMARQHAALLAARDRLVAQNIEAKQQLAYWWADTGRCPCGARRGDEESHPHVSGCPTAYAFDPLGSPAEPCLWRLEHEDADSYRTACGKLWEFTTGGPEENQVQFCPYCGRRLIVESASTD